MDGQALRRVRQSVMRAPAVRHGAAEGDHGLEHGDLSLQRLPGIAGQSRRLRLQRPDELISLLRQELDAVGGQQLVVAERGGNRLRPRSRVFQSRLHIVLAVAAGFERVDPNSLFPGNASSGSNPGVSAFILDLALRLLRNKSEFSRRRLQQVGDDGHVFPRRRLLHRCVRIDRSWRSCIDRRLRQDVVVDPEVLIAATFAIPRPPLVRDGAPIRVGFGVVLLTGGIVFRHLAIVFDRGKYRLRNAHRRLRILCGLSCDFLRQRQQRCRKQAPAAVSDRMKPHGPLQAMLSTSQRRAGELRSNRVVRGYVIRTRQMIQQWPQISPRPPRPARGGY